MKLYYLFHIRITNKGIQIYSKKVQGILTQNQMNHLQKKIARSYKVSLANVAFSFSEIPSWQELILKFLNEKV